MDLSIGEFRQREDSKQTDITQLYYEHGLGISRYHSMITTTASVNSDQLDPPFPRTDQRTTRTTEELHPPPALPSLLVLPSDFPRVSGPDTTVLQSALLVGKLFTNSAATGGCLQFCVD